MSIQANSVTDFEIRSGAAVLISLILLCLLGPDNIFAALLKNKLALKKIFICCSPFLIELFESGRRLEACLRTGAPDSLKERNVRDTMHSIVSYEFGEC